MKNSKLVLIIFTLFVTGFTSVVVNADNTWGKYHWNISTDDSILAPLELGNNLSYSFWEDSLLNAVTDWNGSVLQTVDAYGLSDASCSPRVGRVEVCNDTYGDNNWLGIASIWVTRGRSAHITQGVVKVNDTYYNTSPYNTDVWRDFVMCQEVGHTLGLDHQDTNFGNDNLGTCMDYTNDPDGTLLYQASNLHPNEHDYDTMTAMYAHLNSTDSDDGGGGNGNGNGRKPKKSGIDDNTSPSNASEWGLAIGQNANGRDAVFGRSLSNGQLLITHVLWID